MIYFCETNKTKGEHAFINSQLVQLIAKACPSHNIHCYASLSHWKELSEVLSENTNYYFSPITVLEPQEKQKIRWIIKILLECFATIGLIRKATKKKVSLIFFSSMSPLTNVFVHIWLKWFISKDVKVIITLHGELQLIKERPGRKLIDKIYKLALDKALRMRLANRKFLVLNELIKNELVGGTQIEPVAVLSIPHPYHKKHIKFPNRPTDKIVFGHLGTAKLAKNSHLFFALAKQYANSVSAGKAAFVINGQVLPEILPFQNNYVEYQRQSVFVETKKYEEQCSAMHYAIFMYTDDQYSLVSSGAIMDAIAFGLPIICLKNKYFEYLFGLCKVKPGILCEHYEEIVDNVQRLIRKNDDEYDRYLLGMNELQTYFSIEKIQRKFDDQVQLLRIKP
ncbi:glycosyltransferase family protein [Parapedobacter koreensis]|uniref:Glycosyltransferase involved in cell wall bisynthesis n=1 Tax=Parapedobacter koreensis TaxID=332977 RepID=A0A1H7RGL5_9SPHI|nr:glycosyltransferase [Parapedobacter koreensis]SEL59249.1 Glycosyltransferase involved in cell wall bisynthesis [Parapedobacter koreensis]